MVHRRVVQTLESFLNASQFPAFIYHHPVVVQYLVSDESAEGFPSFFLYFLAATLTQSLWGFRQESNLSCRHTMEHNQQFYENIKKDIELL